MSNPVEYWQLQEVMAERPTPPEDHIQASLDWETDPDAWKEPDAAPPAMKSLLDNFEDLYDEKSLVEGMRGPLATADPEFFDLVKAYWAQLKRDNSPLLPVTADANELHTLQPKDMAVTLDRMNEIMRTVFDWMISQGKMPVDGWTTWNVALPPQLEDLLED